MQIRTKLIALSGCGLLAVGSLVFVFHSSLGKIGAATDSMTTISSALRNHLEGDMMHDAIKGDVLAAQLAKTDADFAAVNKDLADHAEWFRKCLSANKELELPSEVKTALADAQPALDQYILAAETIIAQRKFDEASLTNFNAAFSHLEEANEKLSDLIETAVQTAGANQSGTRSTANITSLILAAASSVVFGLISFMTGRSIVTSLTSLRATLTKFAQGDLSDRMDTSSNDELAQVATEANNMADSMSKMVEQIRAASEQVAAAAQEIEASGQEVRRQTDDQVAKIEQLEAALTEFSQGTEQVAAKSTEATSTAEQSGRAATEGGDVVNEALAGMKTIDTTVTESATLIQDLGKRGEQIGEIIRVIDDIAEQTNLLALNAAIEAARAGDHGRGFAVVADEVRKLADRTTKATEEIGRSITAIREQTGRAVEQMGMGTTRVREGVERAQTARERLEEIVSGTNNVSSMIGSIAAAAEQQRAATRSVLDGITEITTSSRAVRDGANESAQAATLLADNATRMRDLVNRFKVAPERSKS